jgi:predicted PurR-regulated permease PerM
MKKIIATIVAFTPVMALAQATAPINNVNDLAKKATDLGNLFTYLLIAAAVIFIIWHVVIYLVKGGSDEEARKKAGSSILWGIVGLFVILSIWGLVNILKNTLNTTPVQQQIPQINTNLPPVQ